MRAHPRDPLSETFAALADPTRRAILARLIEGPASVSELAEPFDISLPAVSRHLRVLTEAGLIAREKDAQFRRCSLSADGLREAADWLARYRRFWEASFDRLGVHLEKTRERRASHRTKTPSEANPGAKRPGRGEDR